MTMIPVFVQRPGEPSQQHQFGFASDALDPDEVADQIGVPAGCFMEGRILKLRGERCWSLVALVQFRPRGSKERIDPGADTIETLTVLQSILDWYRLLPEPGLVPESVELCQQLRKAKTIIDRANFMPFAKGVFS